MDRILIIRFSSLGDVILATSVIDAVRQAWPECAVTFVVKEEYSPVLEQNPGLSRIIALGPDQRGLRSIYGLGRRLSREGVDLILDLQGGVRGRLLTSAAGAARRSRVNSRRVSRMLMTRRPSRWRRMLPHAVDRYHECLGSLVGKGQVATQGPRVWLTDLEISGARSNLKAHESSRLVALAPGAKWRTKRWPERYFARLAVALAREGVDVIVLGSSEEKPLLNRIAAAAVEGAAVTAVTGGIRELAASLALCEGAVCNDSGLMHLAAAVGTPSLGLFGPTAPHFGFAPYGSGHETLWLGLECSPCSLHGDKPCRIAERAPCLEGLDPDRVLGALRPMLAATGTGRRDRTSIAGKNG